MMKLVFSAGCSQHHPIQHALHIAGDTGVIDRGGQQNAICFDALFDDGIYCIVLHASQGSGIQTAVAGKAGLYVGTGLHHFKFHTGFFHLCADDFQQPGIVAVLSGASVDRDDFHWEFLLFLMLLF